MHGERSKLEINMYDQGKAVFSQNQLLFGSNEVSRKMYVISLINLPICI